MRGRPHDVLPDSRTRRPTGTLPTRGGDVVPVYCANCGAPHGYVPAFLVTHVFALCDGCLETHGRPAHGYREPEVVFWERLSNAMNEHDVHTADEIARRIEREPDGVFARLKSEWDRMVLAGRVA